jgi:O-antigen/teichoic acid export membrane protein
MTSLVRRIEKWMAEKPGRSATVISWLSQGFSIAANLAIVPLVLHRVGQDAGIWFFLLGWMSLFLILDFGFSQCISRQITFSFGQKGILKGRPKGRFIRVGGPRTIGRTMAASRMIFRSVSVIILLAGIGLERTVLFSGRMEAGLGAHLCWYLIVAGSILVNESRVYSTALVGMLLVSPVRLVGLFQLLLQNGLIIVFLLLSPHIVWMGLAVLLGSLFAQGATFVLWLRRRPPHITISGAKWSMVASLWRSSWEQGVANTASYFIFTANSLVIGYLLGKEAVAIYYLPWRIATILFSSLAEIITPQINFMIGLYRDHQVHALLVRFFRIFIVISVPGFVGFLAFALAGPWLVHLWSAGKIFAPLPLYWITAVYYFLALVQTLFACFIVVHGLQPFVRPAVAGAVLNVVLLFLLLPRMGLVGAGVATFTAQLLTSNWYVTWVFARLLAEHARVAPLREAWRDAVRSLRRDLRLG